MERAKALHTIMVEMTTGMLVLAALAIIFLTAITLLGGGRWRKFVDAADAVALWGTIIGTPMILLAVLSGFRQWPLEAFLHSVIARNKIFTSLVALGFWAAFLALRLAAGRGLWERKGLAVWAFLVAIGGAAFLVFTASIGGALARKPSGFEEIARTVVETRATFTLPAAAAWTLIALGVAAPVVAVWRRMTGGRAAVARAEP